MAPKPCLSSVPKPPDVLVIAARTDTVDAASIVAAVRRRSDLPILVGAAPGEDDLAREALAAGASAVIARPYDITAIAPFALKAIATDCVRADPPVYIAGPIDVDRARSTRPAYAGEMSN